MEFEIQKAESKKQLIAFIKFPFSLYKGNACYVPPLIEFELSTFLRDKNPAYDHCDANFWVVKQGSKIVGRIAGICINQELSEKSLIRFGWLDFVDEKEVSALLFKTLNDWARELGAKAVHGPMGFTDLDFEGLLISGFDEMATQATIYNYPYYKEHLAALEFQKAADWVEVRLNMPPEVPRRIKRAASFAKNRAKLEVKEFKRSKELLKYAPGVFDVLNKTYADLYGFYPLTEKQIQYYVDQYFGFVRKELVNIIVDENDEVVAMAITVPSLSKAFQKAKGSLFPLGFLHVLRAFYSNKHVDLFLIGVKPEFQKLGANALIFDELLSVYIAKGFKHVSTGPMLADNHGVLNQWDDFKDYLEPMKIRRRCFIKEVD